MNNKSQNIKAELPNDGERMIPEYHKNSMGYGDHIARYESTLPFVKDKIVLDIASGSGYGTQMISKNAKHVYGVDIEEKAINYAISNFNAPNISFKVGSGTAIPLDNDSIDTVVTFETLEHIENSEKFVSEIKRVLKKNGQLVLSTPNNAEFPKGNHFHVHEFEYEELITLLKKHFKYVDSYYQATWIYTGIGKEDMIFKEWDNHIRVINTSPLKREQVLYFMVVCSNEFIEDYIETLGVISEHWSAKKISIQNNEVQDYIKKTIKHYEGILKAKDEQILELNKRVDHSLRPRKFVRIYFYIKSKVTSMYR